MATTQQKKIKISKATEQNLGKGSGKNAKPSNGKAKASKDISSKGTPGKGTSDNKSLKAKPKHAVGYVERALGIEDNFLALDSSASSYDASDIVIISAPYEKTVSYGGGTKDAPKAIIEASHYVEFFDDEFQRELCFERGIATLPALDFGNKEGKEMLQQLEHAVSREILEGKFVVTLGGEHTISTAPINAHFAHYPNISVLHFDAHSDLRQEYSGTPYSHACFMARVAEAGFPMDHVVQVGIRAQSIEEWRFAKQNRVKTFYATAIRRGDHGKKWQREVVEALQTDDIYITFDVDYFDPSIMPTTGTPEPDGFQWSETMEIFRRLNKAGKRIVGFDVVELSPNSAQPHSTYLVAKLIYRMLNFAFAR